MGNVNYIKQMNTLFERFNRDERIKQGHITLYLAFFQKWNRECHGLCKNQIKNYIP